MKKHTFLLFIILLSGCFFLQGIDNSDHETEIRALMKRQLEEWNRGNFEGFMAPYWNSEKMTFQSGNTRRYGWKNLLDMYTANYAGDKRGVLDFTDLEITFLTEDLAYVLGRWQVVTGKGAELKKKEGLFTLILRRFSSGWRIIHDHSS